jgi:tRNA G18 (ribose-2'-O)-methylase SpoU
MKKTLKEILEIKEKENACIVVMDELTDVHNVGAIIRTAVATGVDA